MENIIRKAFKEKINQLLPDLRYPLLITNFDGQNANYWMFTLQTDHVAPSFLLILPGGKIYAFVSPIETDLLSGLKNNIEIMTYPASSKLIPLIKKITRKYKYLSAEYSDNYNFDIIRYSWLKKLRKEFSLKPAQDVIFPLRKIKTPAEIGLIRKSVNETYEILKKVENKVRKNVTEIDIYNLIYFEARKKNAEVSFKPIIASGRRAVNPHPIRATDKRLKNGEFLIVDLGVSFYGYTSDITRTFLVGDDIRGHKFYKVAKIMFNELESLDFSKISPYELAEGMRKISKKHKVDIYEKHAYGHGIGVAVHDIYPSLSLSKNVFSRHKFQDGTAFAFEPGFYTKKTGFRWENDYFINNGKAVKF
ncbi:MAG: Xaa-Pro peptidase family protein [bacterium]